MGLMSIRRVVAAGFASWVFLTGVAFYCIHFQGMLLKKETFSMVEIRALPVKGERRTVYSQEHEDHLFTSKVLTSGTPQLESGRTHSDGAALFQEKKSENHKKSTVSAATVSWGRSSGNVQHHRLSVVLTPAPAAHFIKHAGLSNRQSSLNTPPPPLVRSPDPKHRLPIELADMRQHPLPTAALPSVAPVMHDRSTNLANPGSNSVWRVHRKAANSSAHLVNGKYFMYSKNRNKHLYSHSKYRYRSWYHKEVHMARQWCTNKTCLLSSDTLLNGSIDMDYYSEVRCFSSAIMLLQKSLSLSKDPKTCSCSLKKSSMEGGKRSETVGLVSLPGSGNTWIRGLLEQVTGICTGSMWCDANLRATQFCAEGVRGTRTLVVKNHDANIRWRGQSLPQNFTEDAKPQFDRVVFIHRNPFESIVAEHNREIARSIWEQQFNSENYTTISSNDHVLYFGKEYFGNNSEWNETVYRLADSWRRMVHHLLVYNADRPVLLVLYEDLKHNLLNEVNRILTFLDVKVEQDVLRKRLEPNFNVFYRNHTSHFDHFTSEQRTYINHVLSTADPQVASRLPLTSYLRF